MIWVDSRIGSKDLAAPLTRLGLPAELTTLPFGDIAFEGQGDDRGPLTVGIEFKVLTDLVQSLRSGRLVGHQVPGLRQTWRPCLASESRGSFEWTRQDG